MGLFNAKRIKNVFADSVRPGASIPVEKMFDSLASSNIHDVTDCIRTALFVYNHASYFCFVCFFLFVFIRQLSIKLIIFLFFLSLSFFFFLLFSSSCFHARFSRWKQYVLFLVECSFSLFIIRWILRVWMRVVAVNVRCYNQTQPWQGKHLRHNVLDVYKNIKNKKQQIIIFFRFSLSLPFFFFFFSSSSSSSSSFQSCSICFFLGFR